MLTDYQIAIGDEVRSFDFPIKFEDGRVGGMDLEGERACYVEGRVEGFEWREGCERYVIRVAKRVFGGVEREIATLGDLYVYPPRNGTPSIMSDETFGVVRCGASAVTTEDDGGL